MYQQPIKYHTTLPAEPAGSSGLPTIGVISNPLSHLNKTRVQPLSLPQGDILAREPATQDQLVDVMGEFAIAEVDLIIVDGGDGTVRDVLTAALRVYGATLPRIAVLPSGKTNALAIDLKIPRGWTIADAVEAHCNNRVKVRQPLAIYRRGWALPDQLGFIFGSGAYVRATELAQHVHKYGWVNGVGIALALSWAILQTFLGGADNPWRQGETIRFSKDRITIHSKRLYLLLASTLKRMPLGLKPFGPVRDGLKFLAIKAPPRRLLFFLPRLLRGSKSKKLDEVGYVREDADKVFLSIDSAIILDGERFPGGRMAVGRGAPIEFVVP